MAEYAPTDDIENPTRRNPLLALIVGIVFPAINHQLIEALRATSRRTDLDFAPAGSGRGHGSVLNADSWPRPLGNTSWPFAQTIRLSGHGVRHSEPPLFTHKVAISLRRDEPA